MEWTFEIPFMPPSVNQMYVNSRKLGVRFKSPELNLWEKRAGLYLKMHHIEHKGLFRLEIDMHSRWYNLNGTVKKRDCSNYIKAIEDALFKAIGRDDSEVFELFIRKTQSKEDKVLIRLSLII